MDLGLPHLVAFTMAMGSYGNKPNFAVSFVHLESDSFLLIYFDPFLFLFILWYLIPMLAQKLQCLFSSICLYFFNYFFLLFLLPGGLSFLFRFHV